MNDASGKFGSQLILALFIIVGIVTLYDTTGYSDRDSKVFPQTVAIALILFATIAFVMNFVRSDPEPGFGEGSWWRRILLIVTMLITSLIMPYIGFLAAAAIAFAGGLIAAMHDRWTMTTVVLYRTPVRWLWGRSMRSFASPCQCHCLNCIIGGEIFWMFASFIGSVANNFVG
jgi:putative tricarboxylic transport membrane protein